MKPHRGQMMMILGILSLFVAQLIMGPIVWYMAASDLKEMKAGTMDPAGESNTNIGKICAMISTILGAGSCVCVCIMWLIFGAALFGTAATVPTN